MIRNYLKTAIRNLAKNKTSSVINILGLSIGLTCCMLITLYLYHELDYDKYHKNINQLYELGTTFVKDGKEFKTPNTPAPMAIAMKKEFPEILETARMMPLFAEDKTLLQCRSANGALKSFYETGGRLADASFFSLFTYQFVAGNPVTALLDPNSIVLCEDISRNLFGDHSALGKVVHVNSSTNGEFDFKVTGVFRPMPRPTQIDARFFLSIPGGNMDQFIKQQTDMISNNMFSTFLMLKPSANVKGLEAKFPEFVDKYMGKELKYAGFSKKQFLVSVKGMHLYSGMSNDMTARGSISSTYLYVLASIAIFTLLIACINFMNLSTARSSKRAAEVGIRKVLGAEKRSLVWQFLSESMVLAVIALLIALIATRLLLPKFSVLSGKNLSLGLSEQGTIVLFFLLLTIITGFIAGSYPAFYLSSFQPVRVLKGKIANSLAVMAIRKGLVVFQFFISVLLIIASVVIANQMQYLRRADLGFTKDQQIIMPLRSSTAKSIFLTLKNQALKDQLVENAGGTLYYPGIVNPSDMSLYRSGKTQNDGKLVHTNWVDESLLQTLGIKAVAGRLFSRDFPSDTDGRIILNESAIRDIGFKSPQDAIGGVVKFDWRGQTFSWTVIGVVKDFHFQDLHVPISPYAFQLNNQMNYNYLVVHAKALDVAPLLKDLQADWHQLNPSEPFEFSFLDEDFQRNYQAEERLAGIVGYFTLIAILISCLGLFGLAVFSAEQRTKEIGVRKVLGASVTGIVGLLSMDFLKLVAIAIVIASPVAWLLMNKWLQDFSYRTSIGWTVFATTTFAAMLIAVITISFQAIRAAMANPVKSLRTE